MNTDELTGHGPTDSHSRAGRACGARGQHGRYFSGLQEGTRRNLPGLRQWTRGTCRLGSMLCLAGYGGHRAGPVLTIPRRGTCGWCRLARAHVPPFPGPQRSGAGSRRPQGDDMAWKDADAHGTSSHRHWARDVTLQASVSASLNTRVLKGCCEDCLRDQQLA